MMGSPGAQATDIFFSGVCNGPLWNVSAAWESRVPEFGSCVERTVLVWTPCLLLWVSTILYLPFLKRRPLDPLPWTALIYTKLMVSVLMLVTAGVEVVWAWVEETIVVPPADYLASVVLLLTQVIHLTLVLVGRRRSERNSIVLWLFWLLMVLCGLPQLYTTISSVLHGNRKVPATLIVTFMVQYLSSMVLFITNCICDAPSKLQKMAMTEKPSPELNASIVSRLFFFWSGPLIWAGWQQPLTFQDLWDVVSENSAIRVYRSWLHSTDRGGRGEGSCNSYEKTEPKMDITNYIVKNKRSVTIMGSCQATQVSILRGLWNMTKWPLFLSMFLNIVSVAFNFVTPQLLSLLIGFVTDQKEAAWHGYLYAVALFFTCELASLIRNMCFNIATILTVRVRSALMCTVYVKALKLSGSARRESTVGQIVNLMAVDAQTIGDTCLHLSSLFGAPISVLVSLGFLWSKLGPSVLAGLVVLLLIIPINSVIVQRSKELQAKAMTFKDKRVKMASEIINGIKVLKLYAWEASFAEKAEEVRNKEVSLLKKLAILQTFNSFIFSVTPYMVALATFTTYLLVSDDNVLDSQKAFVSIALLNLLRLPIIQMPNVISQLIQAGVSKTRMQKFLNMGELDPEAVCSEPSTCGLVVVRGGQFSWEGEEGKANWSLQQVELEVKKGQLVAVVGPVGAGKSSLISALLGEMRKDAGKVIVNGSVAYVSQQAWLQNATLRDNITWGQPFELKRYKQVVKACALQADIDMLPAGDMTEIGEKGINVSGGQKQRVALARAVYSDASIILLDDPLSAVDSHVGRHIFDHVIGPHGVLKHKTRVLVTHALTFLPQVDTVLVMRDGRLVEKGAYTQLVASGGEFAQFILQHFSSMDNEEVEELEELCDQLEEVSGGKQLIKQVSLRRSSLNITRELENGRRHRTVSETDKSQKIASSPTTHTENSCNIFTKHSQICNNHNNIATNNNDLPIFLRNISCSSQQFDNVSNDSSMTSTISRSTSSVAVDLPAYNFVDCNSSIKRGQILVDEETAETGKISRQVFLVYGRAMGAFCIVIPIIFMTLAQASNAGGSVWLSQWTSTSKANTTITSNTTEDIAQFDRDIFLAGYGAFGVGQAIFLFVGLLMVMLGGLRAANILHHHLLRNIIRLPMSFFDTNPSGRIINRFSKEINVLDYILPQTLRGLASILSTVVMTMIVIVAATPIVSVFVVPIMCVYCFIQQVFVATSRQIKRIESNTRSPIFSHFSESIQGASVIRAYRKQDEFFNESLQLLENSLKPIYSNIATFRWLGVNLETIGNLITFSAAIMGVAGRDSISPGIVGLSVTYALNMWKRLPERLLVDMHIFHKYHTAA
ncbi:ATP-binding cassette sub-family C member 3 isoform X2 [Procambarus clarkii]|uniref:ATP-binding cassette sub-family C member 3 isoform X2 n=1 Tax=Procambarus clarkii TaxID=6728 RepID=UPI00374395A7